MTDIIRMAVWFGLVTGLIEGVGFLAFQSLGWLAGNRACVPVALDIIWVAAAFDLLLFGVVGIGLATVARLLPRAPMAQLTFAICALLAFYDWLALSGNFYRYGVVSLALGLTVVLTRWFRQHEATGLRFFRRSLPVVVALAMVALAVIRGGQWLQERAATAQLPPASAGSPNILVIVVDTLRADHLSTYGYGRPTSPNLDRLAQQGVVFENAVSTSSWTLPSHASLLTGRYTYEHGAVSSMRPLDDRYPTIPGALRARGYRTGAFSANVRFFNHSWGFGRGFIHFEDYFQSLDDMALRTLYGREAFKYLVPLLGIEDIGRKRAPEVNRAVLRWIERDRKRPFFAFLNYFDTHGPYVPPQPYRSKFAQLKNPGGALDKQRPCGGGEEEYPDLTPEQLQGEIDAYDGAIAYTDDHINQLLSALRQRGLLQNTVVVVTADHGESFGEHGLFLHLSSLYWELIHVPLIIVHPGVVPAGVRVARPVSNAALPSTLMGLVSAADAPMFPQASLSHYWKAADSQVDWPLPLAELRHHPFGPRRAPVHEGGLKSLVSPEWHYIVHDKFGVALYDWKNDPGELHNLAQAPELHDVVSQFGAQLAALVSHAQAPGPAPVTRSVKPNDLHRERSF